MSKKYINYYTDLKSLFALAKKNGYANYVFTLLRIKGITDKDDPFIVAKRNQYNPNRTKPEDEFIRESLEMILNLLNCVMGNEFQSFPFIHLQKGQFPNFQPPSIEEIISEIDKKNEIVKIPEFARVVQFIKLSNLPAINRVDAYDNPKETNRFIDSLLRCYFSELRFYKKMRKLHRWPSFMVLELLVNEKYGLYGFKVHFSDGSTALYERNEKSSMSFNILSSMPIRFMMTGSLPPKNEYMVGDKRLYEIGLEGRYNRYGEWAPITMQASSEYISRKCREIAKGDDEVEGCLFYVMCTGHRVIEFVAKSPIDLPLTSISLGDRMHLYKCEPSEEDSHVRDFIIYDGSYKLEEIDPESIKMAIASITVGLNRMAFAYNSSVEWHFKYKTTMRNPRSQPTPTKKDLKVFNSLLVDFPSTEDAFILDIAIDWYHRAELVKVKNSFVAFLCYYIALETVSISVADGDADLGLNFKKEASSDRKKRIVEEIKKKHDEEFLKDPIKFIEEGYFEYVKSLKDKTLKVTELVFGEGHDYISKLFKKQGEQESLYSLRGKLAHGGITLLSSDDRKVIQDRLYEMSQITGSFLKRVIFLLKPSDELPRWSGSHKLTIFPSDPRDTMIASDFKTLGRTDWKIRPEWLD